MNSQNNESYHELTKQTMDNVFLSTGLNFVHKYKHNGHEFISKDNGKKICISANKDVAYIYVLKNNSYEIESIENVMKEIREEIFRYSLKLLQQDDYINIETLSTEDYLKYVDLHKMIVI